MKLLLESASFIITISKLFYFFLTFIISLRTSDTSYLMEACAFFMAIRERNYFAYPSKDCRREHVIKKLRYYTRFIVASLLLKRLNAVHDLIKVSFS